MEAKHVVPLFTIEDDFGDSHEVYFQGDAKNTFAFTFINDNCGMLAGVARLNPADTYNPRIGLKVAFAHLLYVLDLSKECRTKAWEKFFKAAKDIK